jgi:hypothetical protein
MNITTLDIHKDMSHIISDSTTKTECENFFSTNITDPSDPLKNITIFNKQLYCMPILFGNMTKIIRDFQILVSDSKLEPECEQLQQPLQGPTGDSAIDCFQEATHSVSSVHILKPAWNRCASLAPEFINVDSQSQAAITAGFDSAYTAEPNSASNSSYFVLVAVLFAITAAAMTHN